VHFGQIDALAESGCFLRDPSDPTGGAAIAQGPIRLNGLEIIPGAGQTLFDFDTSQFGVGLEGFPIDDLVLGALEIKNLSVDYTATGDVWKGGATLNIPAGTPYFGVTAQVEFDHGDFTMGSFDVALPCPGVPLFTDVYLNGFSGGFDIHPPRKRFFGSLTVGAIPLDPPNYAIGDLVARGRVLRVVLRSPRRVRLSVGRQRRRIGPRPVAATSRATRRSPSRRRRRPGDTGRLPPRRRSAPGRRSRTLRSPAPGLRPRSCCARPTAARSCR
jgi:hypothetical protein